MISIKGVLMLAGVVVAVVVLVLMALLALQVAQNPGPAARDLVSRIDEAAKPGDSSTRDFTVREGEAATEIADRLEAAGLIKSALAFRLLAEVEGHTSDLAAGEYGLSPGMRPSEILTILVEGRTKPPPMVTIPEGWRAEEIADRLASRGIGTAEQFMSVVRQGHSSDPALMSRPPGASLEGYLFPDSYSFDSKTTMEVMADRMVAQFDARFSQEMREKAAALGMSVHQAVTLASIIEREAVLPSERPLMAGVFYNRLKEGMLLQSDPTVQYALASTDAASQRQYGWWKKELTEQDLRIDSPYNSYRYPGLPPGPICNPGIASLMAAVNPTPTDYLYFVARPDGSHAFAKTLEEHNQNVARYR